MAFPGSNYAPPSVYTRTLFENPFSGSIDSLKIPVFIGEGNEYLVQRNLELVRGSSASIDQRRANEDQTGRAVVNVTAAGAVTLGAWDGSLTKLQVQNLPVVTGDGTGTVTTSRSDVSVTINGLPIVVLSVDGTTGIIELAQAPKVGDLVKVSYWFNRMDTLITDDVSDQVTSDPAFVRASTGINDVNAQAAGTDVVGGVNGIFADVIGPNGEVTLEGNNLLNLIVDGVTVNIVIPSSGSYTMQQCANAIAAQAPGTSLTATTFINNHGQSALRLNADEDITILSGSANAPLGLVAGTASVRTKTFYTFQGPIVTGDNGGVTTTDPSHVTVKVNGTQVIPTAVDGATRAVTLSSAPPVGATVTIRYYFNSWQNTFDFLLNDGVTSISAVGSVPDSADFTNEADYILKDDKILWGTAWTVEAGESTAGSEQFDETQVSGTLIDDRTYLSECSAVVNASGGVATASVRDFILPFSPTLGNGRDTPLGSSLFQTVANGRIDQPTNRPDVVTAFWGYGVQDALDRGPITVLKVEGNVMTLSEDVPVGANVYANFYYNRLTDETYTLTNTLAGVSGVGTYTVTKDDGSFVLNPSYSTASKGAGLVGTTVVFPSGSELTPDFRFESVSGSLFTGPVEETVTVTFETRESSPARWSSPGAGPYYFVEDQSDRARLNIDNVVGSVDSDLVGGGESIGLDLTNPTGNSRLNGFFATLVSDVIDYTGEPDGGAGASVVGESYTLTTPEDLVFFIDGVQVDVTVPATPGAGRSTIDDFVNAINLHAGGWTDAATAGGVATLDISGLGIPNSDVDDYFIGWNVTVGTSVLATDGQTHDVIAHDGATEILTVSVNWAGGAMAGADTFRLWNPDTLGVMTGVARINGAVTVTVGGLDQLRYEVGGTTTALTDSGALTLAPASYANATALAAAIEALMNGAAPVGWEFRVGADGDGRITVKFHPDGDDAGGWFRFVTPAAGASRDLARLMGFDVGAFGNTDGTYLIEGEVAKFVNSGMTIPLAGTKHIYDRLVLRNKLVPGGGSGSLTGEAVEQMCELRIGAGSGNTKAGLENGGFGEAGNSASVQPATVAALIGVAGGQEAVTDLPQVTFFDGTGAKAKNDTFRFVVDGRSVEVAFTSSDVGTATNIGPASVAGSVMGQIRTELTALGLSTSIVQDEGLSGIRLVSQVADTTSAIEIGDGDANSTLGFATGATALRSGVSPKKLASALNNHRHATWSTFLTDFSATTGGGNPSFVNNAFASTIEDAAGSEYLYIESLTQGTASVVTVRDPVVGATVTDSWLFPGTGMNAVDLDGAVGEAGISGFFVTSNKANGSGSADDSLLNDGTGSDGVVGQTYRDAVTGLTFTILPQNYHNNPTGPWTPYPSGATANFTVTVSKTITTDANIPVKLIPGFEMKVANTSDIGVEDTALVQTFERGGEEPAVGDVYYTTYVYSKESFDVAYYTKLSSIENAYGSISSDNPVSLAAYLAALNGAVLMGIKQVPKAEGSNFADLTTYRDAIESLEGVQPGQVNPDIITPLRGDSTDLYTLLKKSNEIQSSIRYKSERTSIIGLSSGNDAVAAQSLGQNLGSDRMRVVYPDTAIISLTDAFNRTREEVVDGTMLAAALAGSVVSPNYDVASPWTGRNLNGFVQLGRLLDAVEMNQTASKGVTVIEERPPFMRVRHGLTTDISNILRKTPTVRMIADEVQRQSRTVLANFIGVKFLPGILTQIEGRLAMMFKALVAQQIIAAYTGISAASAPDDPTVAEVEAFYQPVFPLLYIVLTFHLRASL